MNIFKIKKMTEEKAQRMEKDLTERLECFKRFQKLSKTFDGKDFCEQIKETEKELHILNTGYVEFLI